MLSMSVSNVRVMVNAQNVMTLGNTSWAKTTPVSSVILPISFFIYPHRKSAKHVLNFSQTVCNAIPMDLSVCNVQIVTSGTLNNAKSVQKKSTDVSNATNSPQESNALSVTHPITLSFHFRNVFCALQTSLSSTQFLRSVSVAKTNSADNVHSALRTNAKNAKTVSSPKTETAHSAQTAANFVTPKLCASAVRIDGPSERTVPANATMSVPTANV